VDGRLERGALATAHRLRRIILEQLGLGASLLVACSGSPPSDDDAGVTTNPTTTMGGEGESGGTTLTTASSGESSDEGDGDAEDSGPILDLPTTDLPSGAECFQEWLGPEPPVDAYPSCEFGPPDPDTWAEYFELCVTLEEGQSCDEICDAEGWCEGMELCWLGPAFEICGPFPEPGQCCSVVYAEPPPPVGRPFLVGGEPRLAALEAEGPSTSSAVAIHWRESAQGEHASIAAFARFVHLLLAHAAPPALVADALAAAADEAEHTRAALGLASRFCGARLELGGLAVADAGERDLASAVGAAVIEGCVDETLAAHEAACLAELAEDLEVAAALERIADDEARHAALAWRFVAWVLDTRPELRGVVEEAFATALEQATPPTQAPVPVGREPWLAWGRPSPELRRRWRGLGLEALVGPCARRLLGGALRSHAAS
jgi:hypothetical protein